MAAEQQLRRLCTADVQWVSREKAERTEPSSVVIQTDISGTLTHDR